MAFKPVTVSQINGYVKRVLQSDPLLGSVSVIGEIANLKYHSSGHVYFSLKDAESKLSCFLPAGVASQLRYQLAEGMEITAHGYISVFERGGSYSLNIRDIEVQGTGNLAAAFEALKAKLQAEGLFDQNRKKTIPAFPHQLVLITSPTGAAVQDMIKVIRSRNRLVNIIVYPVLVQGPAAAGEIAAAIAHCNQRFPEADCIITGRGGGSQEELWAFNEECVARAIAASTIPVISAVGHEIDFSISDFAADLRAATPTEAAVLAVPDIEGLLAYAEQLKQNLYAAGLVQKLNLLIWKVKAARETMLRTLTDRIQEEQGRILQSKAALDELSPYKVLERGYHLAFDAEGKAVTSVEQAQPDSPLTLIFKDGTLDVVVTAARKEERS